MLQTPFSSLFLTPDDLMLLSRVMDRFHLSADTAVDRDMRAATLVRLFQAGICDEEELFKAMTDGSQA